MVLIVEKYQTDVVYVCVCVCVGGRARAPGTEQLQENLLCRWRTSVKTSCSLPKTLWPAHLAAAPAVTKTRRCWRVGQRSAMTTCYSGY